MEIGIDASRSLRAILTGTERYSLEITRHLLALPAASAHAWRLYTDHDVDLDALLVSKKQAVHNAEICVLDARPVWTHRALGPEVIRRPPDVLFVPAHVLPFSPRRRAVAAQRHHDPRPGISSLSRGPHPASTLVSGSRHALERACGYCNHLCERGDRTRPAGCLWNAGAKRFTLFMRPQRLDHSC